MSKIIKKSETVQNPASLDEFRLPVLEKKKPGRGSRSLKFSETVQREINDWQKRYSEYLTSQSRIQSLAVEKAYQEGYEKGFPDGQDQEKTDRITVIETLLKEAKLKKEQAIHERFEKRIEEGLKKIEAGCSKRKCDPVTIAKRVGRLLGQNSRAAGLFETDIIKRADGWAKLVWHKVEAWRNWAALSEGCYAAYKHQ